jgi:MFS family permease
LAAAILASVIAYVDESVVNVALPAIAKDLASSVAVIQWVINAYTLCLAAFLLVGGAASDQIDRRRVFVVGIAIFATASVWCGLSPNVTQLIIARATARHRRCASHPMFAGDHRRIISRDRSGQSHWDVGPGCVALSARAHCDAAGQNVPSTSL